MDRGRDLDHEEDPITLAGLLVEPFAAYWHTIVMSEQNAHALIMRLDRHVAADGGMGQAHRSIVVAVGRDD